MPQNISRETLGNIPLFKDLTEQEKKALIKDGRLRSFSAKQYLFNYGDPATKFYIVCSGVVKVFRVSPDGHEKVSDILIAGSTIGERAIFEASGQHQADAQAVDDTVMMQFPLVWLKDSVKKYPQLSLNLLAQIALQADNAELEAEHQAQNSAARLVACFLQRMCIAHDFNPRGFELPYSKSLIAARLGMEVATFSRTLSKLRHHGIAMKGSHVAFDDIHRLESHVCADCAIAERCPMRKEMCKKA